MNRPYNSLAQYTHYWLTSHVSFHDRVAYSFCLYLVVDYKSPHLPLLRKYVSKNSARKGKALLELLGLPGEKIAQLYTNPVDEEEAVQNGLQAWIGGNYSDPTWTVLLEAMMEAEIPIQHHDDLEAKLLS